MKKHTARIIFLYPSIIFAILLLITFLPWLSFELGVPDYFGVEKNANEYKQEMMITAAERTLKYEINYGATDDPCWGPQGFSMRGDYPYFRLGAFELYAWKR